MFEKNNQNPRIYTQGLPLTGYSITGLRLQAETSAKRIFEDARLYSRYHFQPMKFTDYDPLSFSYDLGKNTEVKYLDPSDPDIRDDEDPFGMMCEWTLAAMDILPFGVNLTYLRFGESDRAENAAFVQIHNLTLYTMRFSIKGMDGKSDLLSYVLEIHGEGSSYVHIKPDGKNTNLTEYEGNMGRLLTKYHFGREIKEDVTLYYAVLIEDYDTNK